MNVLISESDVCVSADSSFHFLPFKSSMMPEIIKTCNKLSARFVCSQRALKDATNSPLGLYVAREH